MRHGFIRPDGSWVTGAYLHHGLVKRELHERRWAVTAKVRYQPLLGSAEIATLLLRGYVRASDACDFEVWQLNRLTDEARTEMEATYLSEGCGVVRIEELGTGRLHVVRPDLPSAVEPNPRRGGTSALERLRAHFGETGDPRLGGYILPDGVMLDFSGGQGCRVWDHGDFGEALPYWKSSRVRAIYRLLRMGAVRMGYYDVGRGFELVLEFAAVPTRSQAQTIDWIADLPMTALVRVDVSGPGGRPIASDEFDPSRAGWIPAFVAGALAERPE